MKRALFILIPLLAGCAQDHVLNGRMSSYKAPKLERELNFFVSNYSPYETNHFYVGATKIDRGQLVSAWVYWKEDRTLLTYEESNASEGSESLAWTGGLKLDRDTVDTRDDIGESSYVETHRHWLDRMEECISKGQLHSVLKTDARKVFPTRNPGSTKPATSLRSPPVLN